MEMSGGKDLERVTMVMRSLLHSVGPGFTRMVPFLFHAASFTWRPGAPVLFCVRF